MFEKFWQIFKKNLKFNKQKLLLFFVCVLILGSVANQCFATVEWKDLVSIIAPGTGWAADKAKDAAATAFFGALMLASNFLLAIPLALALIFPIFSAGLLDWVLRDNFATVTFTGVDNPIIQYGWTQTRDLANMIVVIGLIIVGIATALRIKDYEAQKILAPLIIAAVLINFSPLLCGLVIDGSNIVMKHFLGAPGTYGAIFGTLGQTYDGAMTVIKGLTDNPLSTWKRILGLLFTCITTGFVMLLFFLLFFFRYIALWLLVALAPLAFVAGALKRDILEYWMKQFINWCIIGIPAAFFLWLSRQLSAGIVQNTEWGSLNFVNIAASSVKQDNVLTYLVPGLLALVGFVLSTQISAIGAAGIISFAKRAGNYGWSKAKQAGQYAATKTQTGQRVTMGLREGLGLEKRGAGALLDQKFQKEAGERVAAIRDQMTGEQFVGRLNTFSGQDRSAAFAEAAKRGDLWRIGANNNRIMHDDQIRAAYAAARGHYTADQLTGFNANLARYDRPGVDRIITELGLNQANRGHVAFAEDEAVRRAASRIKPEKLIENYTPESITPPVFAGLSPACIKTVGEKHPALARKIKAYQYSPGTPPTTEHRNLDAYMQGITQAQAALPGNTQTQILDRIANNMDQIDADPNYA